MAKVRESVRGKGEGVDITETSNIKEVGLNPGHTKSGRRKSSCKQERGC